jgi:hypothetical protein
MSHRDTRWLPVHNTTGEEIPAFGVMRPTGFTTVNNTHCIAVDKPNATYRGIHYFNGRESITSGKVGSGTRHFPAWAKYSGGTPSAPNTYEVTDAQWHLLPHEDGQFLAIGGSDGTIAKFDWIGNKGFWGKITARVDKEYTWVEMKPGVSGSFSVLAGGRTGTGGGSNAGFELNESSANFDFTNSGKNLIVRMWEGIDGEYLFDRGLTNEQGTATKYDLNSDSNTWDVNAQNDSEAGAKILDILTGNGDLLTVKVDSHGQVTDLERAADSSNTCTGGPFTGTVTVVESIDSVTIGADCSVTVNTTPKVLCFHNGILQS